MPTVIGHHDVKDTDHWLASPKREEVFGPLGVTNIRTFVNPQNRSQVAVLATLNAEIATMQGEVAAHFGQHPDAEIYLSQPGLGIILGARVLSEFGDDPDRYADAKSQEELRRHQPDHPPVGQTEVSSWPATSTTTDCSTLSAAKPSQH